MNRILVIFAGIMLLGLASAFGSVQWPNEPAGSALISDFGFNSDVGNGWTAVYPGGSPIRSDATAPLSGPSVMEQGRLPGSRTGYCSVNTLSFPPKKELYFAFWWKPSNPFEGQPHFLTKIAPVWVDGGNGTMGLWWLYMKTEQRGGPYQLIIQLESAVTKNSHLGNGYGDAVGTWNLFGNINRQTIGLGQWHRIEGYLKTSSTPSSNDGILRWWMDGSLIGSYTSVNYPNTAMNQVQFTPSWDAPDPTQVNPYYYWFDHVHVSAPNGALPPFFISTAAILTSARVGQPYSVTLQSSGGMGPYFWTVDSGSILPGLSLNKSTGTISGSPTASGKSVFRVKLLDSNTPVAQASKTFTIIASGTIGVESTGLISNVSNVQLTIPGNLSYVVLPGFSSNRNYEVRICDLSGREIWRLSNGIGSARVLAQWVDGTYVLRAKQGTKNYSTKVCVTR